MKKHRVTIISAALGAVALGGVSAVIQANHAWGNYHWARMENAFTLKLGDNVSGTWDPYLIEAEADWQGTAPGVIWPVLVDGKTKPKSCRPKDGRVEVCSEAYGFTGWLGIAQIWISGGEHITQAITKVNDSYFNSPPYNTPDWRQFVMCQEVGHAFGLGHQDENFNNPNLGSCMDYTSDPSTNTNPDDHDAQQLVDIYSSHTDGFNSYEGDSGSGEPDGGGSGGMGGGMGNGMGAGQPSGPPGLDQVDLSEPGEWGRLIASSTDGRHTTHELDLGAGRKVVTHVIWAVE